MSVSSSGGTVSCMASSPFLLSLYSTAQKYDHPTQGCGNTASTPSAKAAALAVDKKLTASLFSQPRRSSVAPSRLSKKRPKTPPAQLIQNIAAPPPSPQLPTAATIPAADTPASVPTRLMAPSVPGSTLCRVVIIRGRPPRIWPISEETVSAAASASAARPAANNSSGAACENQLLPTSIDCASPSQASPATPRLAATYDAVLPSRSSAMPNRSFCSRPRRVEISASKKTASTGIKAVCQGAYGIISEIKKVAVEIGRAHG